MYSLTIELFTEVLFMHQKNWTSKSEDISSVSQPQPDLPRWKNAQKLVAPVKKIDPGRNAKYAPTLVDNYF